MKRSAGQIAVAAVWAVMTGTSAGAQTIETPSLSLEGARRVIAAAKAEAAATQAPGGVIAVVDAGGNLMALERLDGTFAAGANISVGKARTAALFKRPTRVFEELINKGRTAMAALTDFTPLQGGVPIMVEGKIVGGVGVSGAASAQQDEELAIAAAAAIAVPSGVGTTGSVPAPVVYLPGGVVETAFAKGKPLTETGTYKVHASRRDADGLAEVHARDTDILYVLEGTATLVTGGQVVNEKTTAEDELRGDSIAGGDVRRVGKGDVVIVPEGVPHLFRDVKGPFLYYVVKVTNARRPS
ncbi:MAG TPA: heme-binding protein [Vicinamibacterales bacterium]|nr:heme-binding protein [Vicinamibacterales bacterium]